MTDIKIKSLEGKEFGGYCAMPASGNGPGIIVIQEIFGVNAGIRKICDDFAAQGYIAVAPDLFWRQEPNIQLTDKTPAEWDRAMDLLYGFNVEAGVRDLLSTIAYIRSLKGCSGKIGAVGYCLGGKLAFLTATRSDVDAVVSYYGIELDKYLDEIYDIRMPLILHMAALDKYMPEPVRQKILRSITRNPVIKAYIYEGADHAFARIGGEHYNKEAADLANKRTMDFFFDYLKDNK